jgi:hypothetical protein
MNRDNLNIVKKGIRRIICEVLDETLNTIQKVGWSYDGEAQFTASNGKEYNIQIYPLHLIVVNSRAKKLLNIGKKLLGDDLWLKFYAFGYIIGFADEYERDTILGTGNAAEIFSIVGHAVIDRIKEKDIEYICFDAKEPSRKRLYARLAQLLAKELNYNLVISPDGGIFYLYTKELA